MNTLSFKPAKRTAIKPLIGLLGISGGGKTLTALLLARGLAGPTGRVGIIDTENGRASVFVDQVPGGYETMELSPPFSPVRYSEAIDAAEAAGIGCLVIDSATHEWVGPGGYLELKDAALDRMAGSDWKKRDKCGLAAAAKEKPAHNRFVDRVQRCAMPVILCFRGKEKVKMGKDEQGKTTIEKEDHLSAIQDSGLIFEMLLAGEVYAKPDSEGIPVGGFFRCTKYTVADIRSLLPGPDEQFGIKHGKAIAEWARGGAAAKATPPSKSLAKLKGDLWKLTADVHKNEPAALDKYLHNTGILGADETLPDLSEDRLSAVLAAVKQLAVPA